MTIPSYDQSGPFVSDLANLSLNVVFPGGSSGVLVLHAAHNPSAGQSSAIYTFPTTMFDFMFTATGQTVRHFFYIRKADNSTSEATSTSVAITVASGSSGVRHSARMHRFLNASSVWEGGSGIFATSASALAPTVVTLGSSRLAVAGTMIGGQTAAASFSGETGGDWTLAISASSLSPSLSLQTAEMASSGTITGGSFALPSSLNMCSGGFALISDTPGAATEAFSIFDSRIFVTPLFGI